MNALEALNPEQKKQSRSAIEAAKRALKIESDSVAELIDRIDENFATVVHHLNRCTGNVVVVGMGKSGLIGKKIAATFSSIGLPGIFLNAAEASHGDVGIVSKNDIILIISNSGETDEIVKLLPTLNRFSCTLIAMITSSHDSVFGPWKGAPSLEFLKLTRSRIVNQLRFERSSHCP